MFGFSASSELHIGDGAAVASQILSWGVVLDILGSSGRAIPSGSNTGAVKTLI